MKANNWELPDDLLYNDDNSWVKLQGDTATVGVIEPAAKSVEEFVFIQLPEKGKDIKEGEIYVSLEAVKWSGHLKSPVSGQITEINEELFDDPSLINKQPYKSWIMKVKLAHMPKSLMKVEEATEWIKQKYS